MMMRHRWQSPAQLAARRHAEHQHPTEATYVMIAVILAVLTAIEVWVYYIDAIHHFLIPILFVLASMKFFLVAAWFMHLRFDSALFTWAFVGGIVLAWTVFLVVLAASRTLFV